MHFRAFRVHRDTLILFENFRELRATRKGVKIFLLHFYEFQSILSRLRHTFFFEIFCEREARNARERSEQYASVLVRLIVSKFHKKIILSYHIVL